MAFGIDAAMSSVTKERICLKKRVISANIE